MTLSFKTGWCPTGYDFEIIYYVRCTGLGRPAKLNDLAERNYPEEPAEFELAGVAIIGDHGEERKPKPLELVVAERGFGTHGVYQLCLAYIHRDQLVA